MTDTGVLQLIWLGLIATSLDVDNALYMTSVTHTRPEKERRPLLFWGLSIEYAVRLGLFVLVIHMAQASNALFKIGGFEVTPKTIALLGAGGYLFFHSLKGLRAFFRQQDEGGAHAVEGSFIGVLVKMSVVSALLSVDTVFAVASKSTAISAAAIILAVSALVRFFFIEQLANFITKHPNTKIIVLTFLTLVGLQLIFQDFQAEVPHALFNGLLLAAVVAAFWMKHEARKQEKGGS